MVYLQNPNITQATVSNFYDSRFHVNFTDINFRIAWAVENYTNNSIGKDDPYYVEWVAQLYRSIGGVESFTPLPFHKCTEADYDAFHPPSVSYVSKMKQAKKDRNFYCLDDYS